ncbi:hypothetical protein D3C81_2226560 [compost metagenome]
MATGKERVPIKVPKVLPNRIHRKEFLFTTSDLSKVQKAGFIAFTQGKEWMRPDEWKELLDSYLKR